MPSNFPAIQHALLRLKHQAGMTLIETMLVVVISIIMVAAALPSFTAFLNDSRVSSYANEFIGAMTLARTEAVTRGRLVTMCRSENANSPAPTCSPAADWNSGWLVFVKNTSLGNNANFEAGDVVLVRQGPMVVKGKALSNSNPVVTSVTFNALGEPAGGGFDGRFNFSYNDMRPRQICVNRNGRTKVVPGGVDGSVC